MPPQQCQIELLGMSIRSQWVSTLTIITIPSSYKAIYIWWPISTGRQTLFGTQVDHHCDSRNAHIYASAFGFGDNYEGAQLILSLLGYSVHLGHGYSVHGALDILVHGVGQITRASNADHCVPQRISMAMYSHADVFQGAAQFSGRSQKPPVYSNPALWIPFYPKGFSLCNTLDRLRAEEKRLRGKYREEVRQYQAALHSAKMNM